LDAPNFLNLTFSRAIGIYQLFRHHLPCFKHLSSLLAASQRVEHWLPQELPSLLCAGEDEATLLISISYRLFVAFRRGRLHRQEDGKEE
jgi:hypothetical protein